jgi:hypothetical protein
MLDNGESRCWTAGKCLCAAAAATRMEFVVITQLTTGEAEATLPSTVVPTRLLHVPRNTNAKISSFWEGSQESDTSY